MSNRQGAKKSLKNKCLTLGHETVTERSPAHPSDRLGHIGERNHLYSCPLCVRSGTSGDEDATEAKTRRFAGSQVDS